MKKLPRGGRDNNQTSSIGDDEAIDPRHIEVLEAFADAAHLGMAPGCHGLDSRDNAE